MKNAENIETTHKTGKVLVCFNLNKTIAEKTVKLLNENNLRKRKFSIEKENCSETYNLYVEDNQTPIEISFYVGYVQAIMHLNNNNLPK